MNTRQRLVLALTAAVVLLMVIFPPYVCRNDKKVVLAAGYGFLFSLPPYRYQWGGEQGPVPSTVNASQLSVQIAGFSIAGILVSVVRKEGILPSKT